MRIQCFTAGPFGENSYLASCESTGASVAIDPGAGASALVEVARDQGLQLDAILLTHAHIDHVEGIPVVRESFPATPIYLHPEDLALYRRAHEQAAFFGIQLAELPEPDRSWAAGDEYQLGDTTLAVRFAPGHAPGHVILVDANGGVCFAGDVIFQGSIGRTDLPGGDFRTLMTSIREQVLTLPDATRLLTGHGAETTVGFERAGNPFLVPHYLGEMA